MKIRRYIFMWRDWPWLSGPFSKGRIYSVRYLNAGPVHAAWIPKHITYTEALEALPVITPPPTTTRNDDGSYTHTWKLTDA